MNGICTDLYLELNQLLYLAHQMRVDRFAYLGFEATSLQLEYTACRGLCVRDDLITPPLSATKLGPLYFEISICMDLHVNSRAFRLEPMVISV